MVPHKDEKERDCGSQHLSLVDAIRHAEQNLRCQHLRLEPYWGTTVENLGQVVGFQLSSRKRWRLDYDIKKGVHVNEENFDASPSNQKVVHRVIGTSSDLQVRLQWRKWTSGADMPDKVKEEIEFLARDRKR